MSRLRSAVSAWENAYYRWSCLYVSVVVTAILVVLVVRRCG